MAHVLHELAAELATWPGSTTAADLMGTAPEVRTYGALQETTVEALRAVSDSADLWHLQYMTLILVWMLPSVRAELEKASPQCVCTQFFDTFDDLMPRLLFGESDGAGSVALLPVGVVCSVLRRLRMTYQPTAT